MLPWRAEPGISADPYRVWLSEIMLQQTTVATVTRRFPEFLERFPTLEALADAPLAEVLEAWAGLGYYARARNLHACAKRVVAEHDGRFPDRVERLARLPGVGPYTAAAIGAIAFERPVAAIDANAERVLARLHALNAVPPSLKGEVQLLAEPLVPADRPGDFAQALMDLGATVCTPANPRCMICPWTDDCAARRTGTPEAYPRRKPKPIRPLRRAVAYVLVRSDGAVWLRRRQPKGLLGGMMEVPSSDWTSTAIDEAAARRAAPLAVAWRALPGVVRHGFTHFVLELGVWKAKAGRAAPCEGEWVKPDALPGTALPTLMRKVLAHAGIGGARPAKR